MSVADLMGWGPKREAFHRGDHWVIRVTPSSKFVKNPVPVEVRLTEDQYSRYVSWRSGALIQDALPDLSSFKRELLMSGLGR